MNRKIKVAGMVLSCSILVNYAPLEVSAKEVYLYAGTPEVLLQALAEGDLLAHGAERMLLTEQEEVEIEEKEVSAATSEYADIAIATILNYVNLREQPTTESEVLGKLYANSAAMILESVWDESGEQWYKITSGSVENGYVKAEYVTVGDEELIRQVSTRYATVKTTTLFVRSEPGTDSSVLTMLPDEDDVVVLEEREDGWLKVSTEEGDGYIAEEYVQLWTDYIEAESKEEEEARLAREEAEREAAAEAARKAQEEAAKKAAASQSSKSQNSSQNTKQPE